MSYWSKKKIHRLINNQCLYQWAIYRPLWIFPWSAHHHTLIWCALWSWRQIYRKTFLKSRAGFKLLSILECYFHYNISLFQYHSMIGLFTFLWKRLWCWEGLGAGGEGDDRGWDGWMAWLTRWTWVWVNSGSWWWTGRPGAVIHGVAKSRTWLSNWTELIYQYVISKKIMGKRDDSVLLVMTEII